VPFDMGNNPQASRSNLMAIYDATLGIKMKEIWYQDKQYHIHYKGNQLLSMQSIFRKNGKICKRTLARDSYLWQVLSDQMKPLLKGNGNG
jgi:hypothetical protein